MLLHDGSEVGVGDEVGTGIHGLTGCGEVEEVVDAGLQRRDVWQREPITHLVECLIQRERLAEHFGVDGQTHETQQRHPGHADGRSGVDLRLQPRLHGGVLCRIRVHREDEEIDIDDEHEALEILRQLSELVSIETGAESSHVMGFDAVAACRVWLLAVLAAFACLKPLNEQSHDLFDRVGGGWISLAQVMIKLFGGGVHGVSLANGLHDGKA